MNSVKSALRSFLSKSRAIQIGAIEYCINDHKHRTILQIMLLSITYKIAKLSHTPDHYILDVTYRNKDGSLHKKFRQEHKATEAFIWLDSREILGQATQFEGSVEYRLDPINPTGKSMGTFNGAVEPTGFLFWTDDDKTLTSTHVNHITIDIASWGLPLVVASELSRKWRSKSAITLPAAVSLWCKPTLRSSFIYQGGKFGKRTLQFEVRNSQGDSRFASVQSIKPYESREIFPDEHINDLATFADGGFVQLLVHGFPRDIANQRVLVKTYNKASQSFSIDHSYQVSQGKLGAESANLTPKEWKELGKGSFFPHTIEQGPEKSTELVLFNCEYENIAKDFGLSIYRANGTKIFEKKNFGTIPARGFVKINFSDLIADKEFYGHFEAYYTPEPNTGKGTITAGLHGQVFYFHRNGFEGNQVGSAVWQFTRQRSTDKPIALENALGPYVSPFMFGKNLKSRIHISNVGAFDEDLETGQYDMEILNQKGEVLSRGKAILNGTQSALADETFFDPPLTGEIRAVCVMKQKSRFGSVPVHFDVLNTATQTMASDHAL